MSKVYSRRAVLAGAEALVLARVGFAALFTVLDQGHRLDWPNSGLIVALLVTGALACLMAARLTSVWSTPDFLYSQELQAVGQSFALTSPVVIITSTITPAQAVTVGSFMQTSRLLGGEAGVSVMQP
jgi:MFS transporter, DHA2 family, multidrug resistance protein